MRRVGLVGASGRQGQRFQVSRNGGDEITRIYQGPRNVVEFGAWAVVSGLSHVVVATPSPTHYAYVRAALRAGVHVLVEKPLAESWEQCEELIGLAESRGLQLMVAHTHIHSALLEQVSRFSEVHGGVVRVTVNGESLLDWLPHVAAIHVRFGQLLQVNFQATRDGQNWIDVEFPGRQLWQSYEDQGTPTPMARQMERFLSGTWKEDLRAVYRMVHS